MITFTFHIFDKNRRSTGPPGLYIFRNIYLCWMYDAKNLGSKCRTRFGCSLPNQGGIMSHHYMSDGNDTFQESVAGTRGRAVRVWPPAP